MEIKTALDEKILEFADEHNLYIVGQYGRDRKSREVKYYTVATEPAIALGTIRPDCSYEQFLEEIAVKAILEAGRLYDLNDEIEQDYKELCDDFTALKEEATHDI